MKARNNDRIVRYPLILICFTACLFPFFVLIANVYGGSWLRFLEGKIRGYLSTVKPCGPCRQAGARNYRTRCIK
jgi:hypothetical protein